MYLIYNFTNAIELADRLAALSRYTARLYELLDYLTRSAACPLLSGKEVSEQW